MQPYALMLCNGCIGTIPTFLRYAHSPDTQYIFLSAGRFLLYLRLG